MTDKTPLSELPRRFKIVSAERDYTCEMQGGSLTESPVQCQKTGEILGLILSMKDAGHALKTMLFEAKNEHRAYGNFNIQTSAESQQNMVGALLLVTAQVSAFGQTISTPIILFCSAQATNLYYVYHNEDPIKTQAEFIRLKD